MDLTQTDFLVESLKRKTTCEQLFVQMKWK